MVFTFNIGVPKVVKVETHSLKICDGVGWLRGVQQRFWILRFKRSFMSSSIGTTIIHFLQYRFSEWPPSYSSSLFGTVPVQVKILLAKASPKFIHLHPWRSNQWLPLQNRRCSCGGRVLDWISCCKVPDEVTSPTY